MHIYLNVFLPIYIYIYQWVYQAPLNCCNYSIPIKFTRLFNIGRMSEDDASSIYSRSPGPDKRGFLGHHHTRSSISSMPDHPEITPMDHQISDICGSTMALETTAVRLQVSKAQNPGPTSQWEAALAHELKSHQWENEFYGQCYDFMRELLLVTAEAADDLLWHSQARILQHYFEPEAEPTGNKFLSDAVGRLDMALTDFRAQEAMAAKQWKEKWNSQSEESGSTSWI